MSDEKQNMEDVGYGQVWLHHTFGHAALYQGQARLYML